MLTAMVYIYVLGYKENQQLEGMLVLFKLKLQSTFKSLKIIFSVSLGSLVCKSPPTLQIPL